MIIRMTVRRLAIAPRIGCECDAQRLDGACSCLLRGYASPSGPCEHPPDAVVAQSEHGQARPVDRAGTRVEIGTHTFESSSACPAPAPRPADEVGDLAFDDRAVGSVAVGPSRLALFGSGARCSALARCNVAS